MPPERRLAYAAAGRAELFKNAILQIGRRRRGQRILVFEIYCSPFKSAELMEGLHLDPFNVLHRRDKASDAVDITLIVSKARNERESHPHRLADRSKPFGETQGRRQFAAGDGTVGVGIRALDVE